jgi:hypothetical protein
MNINNSKATVIQDLNGLSISIPTATPVFILILSFMTISLMLYSGLYEVSKHFFSTIDQSDYNQIVMAVLLGLVVFNIIKTWLWMLFGKEIIHITNQHLTLKNSILGIGRTKTIPLPEVNQVSVKLNPDEKRPGKILIHHGAKVTNCGTALRGDETVYLVKLMKDKIKTI